MQLMPQRRAHPGQQFIHSEWFSHIVISPEIECLDFPGFIAGVDNMWQRKDAANPCRDVGAAVAIGVDVVKLTNKIKFEVSFEDGFAPYLNNSNFERC